MTTTTASVMLAALDNVDQAARRISGLAVPYGPVGDTSVGPVTFAQGSLELPAQVGRVKLLRDHQHSAPLGYAVQLDDTPAGLRATFEVAAGPDGDAALAEAADGRRDGLSVGVVLDAETQDALWQQWLSDTPDAPVAASGRLVEVSQCALPAFDDARVDGSAALAATRPPTRDVLAGVTVTFTRQTTPAPSSATTTGDTMEDEQLEAAGTETAPETSTPPAGLEASTSTPPARRSPAAAAGAAVEVTEPATYTFNGQGPSLIRDAYRARFEPHEHPDAAARFARFNRMMSAGHAEQVRRLAAAVETRTTAPNYINEGYRPDLLIAVIDKGRPIVSALGTVGLSDATPYRLPVEGEFTGVADHTEGTAHAPEGDLTIGDTLVQPGAISGAFRLSRELIDASNPALDSIAIAAMARDYRRVSEAKANAALELASPASASATTKVAELSSAIDAFFDVNQAQPDHLFVGSTFYSTLRSDVDTTGRPMLARVGSTNANGTMRPGATGAEVDGVELTRAYAIDATAGYQVASDAVHLAESPLSTFRFEEVEGPGVVKLALWAYFAAKVIRAAGVVRLATTDETP